MKDSKSKVNNKKGYAKNNGKWIITIVIWTIAISSCISLFSDALLRKVDILVAFIILIFIIIVGILFDIIGVAVTAASEVPFHSMASKRIPGAKIAVKLIRNADRVSNFCNDVIGDVCGIVSGSVGALILDKVTLHFSNISVTILGSAIGALIAAMTIAGKAVGKNKALRYSNEIIFKVSKIIYTLKKG